MTEWWSYRPSDFLMFSSRVYYRQIESYNISLWPLHLLMLLVGIGLIWLLARGRSNDSRLIAIVLAGLWLFVGWAYLWSRLSSINWAATYLAYGFAAQAILMLAVLVFPRTIKNTSVRGSVGLALMAMAVLLYPGLAFFAGRGWGTAEVFGMMPDPTAVASMGFLASARHRYDFILFVIPTLWCVVSSTTLYTMAYPIWWFPFAMCVVGLAAAVAR